MGYLTNYRLSAERNEAEINEYIAQDEEMDWSLYELDSGGEACKWYEYRTSMKALSLTFPTTLLTLNGQGEEQGDIWQEYWLNGRVQHTRAEIIFDDFDPGKLEVV